MNSSNTRIATVVCLHSSMSHGGQWRALANRLDGQFNVITPNLLGYSGAGDDFGTRLRLEHEVAGVMREIDRVQKALSSSTRFGQMRGAQEFINYWADGDGWSHMAAPQQERLASLTSKAAAEFGALLAAAPATQELYRLNIPVRLLCGTKTRSSARRISELLAEIVPRVEYSRLDGLAHMAPVTHADDVNPLIVKHILANAADGNKAVA